MVSRVKLWLTADRERAVEDGSDAAAFLLAVPGGHVPDAEARRLGLLGNPRYDAGAKAIDSPPEDRALRGPEEAKSEPPFPAPTTYRRRGSGLRINREKGK